MAETLFAAALRAPYSTLPKASSVLVFCSLRVPSALRTAPLEELSFEAPPRLAHFKGSSSGRAVLGSAASALRTAPPEELSLEPPPHCSKDSSCAGAVLRDGAEASNKAQNITSEKLSLDPPRGRGGLRTAPAQELSLEASFGPKQHFRGSSALFWAEAAFRGCVLVFWCFAPCGPPPL